MPTFSITPADSPDLMCDFEVPRTGKSTLKFSVRRADYIPDFDKKWGEWAGKRMTPTPVLDEDGKPVMVPSLDEDAEPRTDSNGEPIMEPAMNRPEPISDKEAIVEQLRVAGVTPKICTELNKLTDGELVQIFRNWQDASKVAVGEFKASAS
ncbi:hypothetical protein [Gordonia malaquae]|uniref:hypothetical protein n=1 Tax=Gordonia malaquae TaxID=410332 RepID=UPI0030FE8CD5